MADKFTVLCAVIVSSGTLACAGASAGRKTVSPPVTGIVRDPTTGLELVHVQGGCFRMGNTVDGAGGPEERPVHEVCVGDFYIGKYEVTQGQWKTVMGSNPSTHSTCGDDCPVETVSWNDVQEFLARLNAEGCEKGSSSRYRLPTEAEWEYAARSGGRDERYSGGNDDLDDRAWNLWNSEALHPVGRRAPNGLGLHDMSGNVWEWTNDWYGAAYYSTSPRDNPAGPSSGDHRVLRGGSAVNESFDLRTSYRNYLPPDHRGFSKGFRLLRPAPTQAR